MIHNETIDTQLNHRSIRKFKDQTLTKEQLETLYSVFGQTPTSMFMQNAITNKLESNLTKTTAVFTQLISFSKQ